MSRTHILLSSLALMGLTVLGCKSTHQDGVKSSYMSQWTAVTANTSATTDAAKSVLETEGLKEVTASSTNVDGTATGKQADGTAVKVSVKKDTDTVSSVTVKVGVIGDPKLGAEIAAKIKAKAEGTMAPMTK